MSISHDEQNNAAVQVLGPGDSMGEGDTYLLLDLLPPNLAEVAFDRVLQEVQWHTMYHRGGEVPRLVAVQGQVAVDGSHPIYRHPADESPPLQPFSPAVALIRQHVERALQHPVNHALLQLYRTGADYISEHADKTVDVVRGASIVNVSLGAPRTMTLRTKKDAARRAPRRTQRVPLPHNSMFVLGPRTNARWMHAVRRDLPAADAARISLTFRHIGTFLACDAARIWGQGACGKTRGTRGRSWLLAGRCAAPQYGGGFDVVHLAPRHGAAAGEAEP
ncbi:hypothetical protein B0H21DRAFT_892734 [Amylocystis lapponica]|nr:hypothetical protein B0H21DRAFT_892734 [Amylocystis lapponica]